MDNRFGLIMNLNIRANDFFPPADFPLNLFSTCIKKEKKRINMLNYISEMNYIDRFFVVV